MVIVYSLNKKTIGIPREGDAFLEVFFSVLANENWKVTSRTCHSHQLPLSGELNTLLIIYEQQVLFIIFLISMT